MKISSVKNHIARILVRLKISADLLTIGGLVLAISAGYFIFEGDFFIAGVLLLCSGLFDLMDGAVARAAGTQSPFGGILDSTLDRYGDASVLGAAAVFYGLAGETVFSVMAVAALAGSFVVSYIRARAECEVDDCRVGFWERGERLVLIALGLLTNNFGAALCLLAAGANWTAFQRLALSKFLTNIPPRGQLPFYLRSSPRSSPGYFIKVGLAVLVVILVRA